MLKFNAKIGEWGSGLRFKSRIFRICLYLERTPAGGIRASQGTFSSLQSTVYMIAPPHVRTCLGLQARLDTNHVIQPRKMAKDD